MEVLWSKGDKTKHQANKQTNKLADKMHFLEGYKVVQGNRLFKNALVFCSRQIKRARCHRGFDAQDTWQSSVGQKAAKLCKTCNACKALIATPSLSTFWMEEAQIHGLKWFGKYIHLRKDRKRDFLKVQVNKCELFQKPFVLKEGGWFELLRQKSFCQHHHS